ncbi:MULTISPECIES: hypothetical protein [Vibrio]|jgi:hypothetical protein|nr:MULTISPECIES: hypothetical protein [Vibrio]MCU8387071.1 hypothetical protein [Vibrio vulnificus]MDF4335922.1 hypothetical protein [Vibrio parahaemolyticus]MEA5296778.1 hypothetical protein [Vibrio parahaemolyticus]
MSKKGSNPPPPRPHTNGANPGRSPSSVRPSPPPPPPPKKNG